MTRRGWAGSPPGTDAEARRRIIEAAMACIDRFGPAKTGLTDVANELGVTRQTVYRHFPSTDQLLEAVTEAGVAAFLDELETHLAPLTAPAEVLVEAVAYCVERLPKERYLGVLLASGRIETFRRGAASSTALAFGRAMLTRTSVDWAAAGFSETDLDGLIEFALRLLASFISEPNPDHAGGPELRSYLRRWLGPAVLAGAPPATTNRTITDRRRKAAR